MLQLEMEIAYDVMGQERSEQEILDQDQNEPMIEKSDITAVGVAVPERLGTEEDNDEDNLEDEYLMEPDRVTPLLPRQV